MACSRFTKLVFVSAVLALIVALWCRPFWSKSRPVNSTALPAANDAPVEWAQHFSEGASAVHGRPPLDSFASQLSSQLEAVESEPDETVRAEKLAALASGLATRDLPTALDLVLGSTVTASSGELKRDLITRWAESEPAAAAAWAEKLPLDRERAEIFSDVAIAWANQDLAAAAEWVQQWPDPNERQAGLTTVAYEAAREQPVEALRLATTLAAGRSRDDLIVRAAAQWASSAPESAAQWAQKIPDSNLSRRLLASIAAEWGNRDPVAAATFALRALPPGKNQDDAIMGIVLRWMQENPLSAEEWVRQFPEGKLRQTALSAIQTR